MGIEKFYKGESLKLQVELNDSEGAPILYAELDDVSVALEVNKKEMAVLAPGTGISAGAATNQMILDVSAEDTGAWNIGRLVAIFTLVIDGETTIEQAVLYDVENA
jgi:hypothetical protein